jgi:hypothetical protein
MKKILFILFLICTSVSSNAGIFGPSNYEECLLENLKNVSNSDAVNAITAACALKFQNKSTNNESRKTSGINICKLYWDGWKLVNGEKPNNSYVTYQHSYQGAANLNISLPKDMAKFLEVDSDVNLPEINNKTKYGKFFNENWYSIKSLCAFN